MEKRSKTDTLCINIFKNGESHTTKQQYTQVWLAIFRALNSTQYSNFYKCNKDTK